MIFLVVQFTFLEFFISWLSSILFSKDINLYFYELAKFSEGMKIGALHDC